MRKFFLALHAAREACIQANGRRWDLLPSETMEIRLPPRAAQITGKGRPSSRIRRDFKIPNPKYWVMDPLKLAKGIEA